MWQRRFLVTFVSAVTGLANAQDIVKACTNAYAGNVRNVSESSVAFSQASNIFNQHCENNGSVRSSTLSGNLETVVKEIPIKFSFSSGSNQEQVTAFCKTFKSQASSFSSSNSYENTIAANALELFNKCLEFATRGIQVTSDVNTDRFSVDVKFYPPLTQVIVDRIFFDKNLAECTTSGFNNSGKVETVSSSTPKKITGKGFTISCVRKGQSFSGNTVYRNMDFALSLNNGNTYTVRLPGDEIYTYALASKNLTDMQKKDEIISSATRQLGDVQAQAKALADARDQLQGKLNGVISTFHGIVVMSDASRPDLIGRIVFMKENGGFDWVVKGAAGIGQVDAVVGQYGVSVCGVDSKYGGATHVSWPSGGGFGIHHYVIACIK